MNERVSAPRSLPSSSPFLIRHAEGQWHEPAVQRDADERMLQDLLRTSPSLLPTHAPGLVVVDEMSVPSIGQVDLAAVTPDGALTLVECKLSSNAEIRRSVIGQIFAYAAGLWRLSYDDFATAFEARSKRGSLVEIVRHQLGEVEAPAWDPENFRTRVANNLRAGRFTLIVAVDRITDELMRVVPFINAHTSDDVGFIALELQYVRDGDVQIVRPVTYGEERANEKRAASEPRWTTDDYLEELDRRGNAWTREVVQRLIDFSRARGGIVQGGNASLPSLNVSFSLSGQSRNVWSSFFDSDGPTFDLNFDWIRGSVSVETLESCELTLRSIPAVDAVYSKAKSLPLHRRRPGCSIARCIRTTSDVETVVHALEIVLSEA